MLIWSCCCCIFTGPWDAKAWYGSCVSYSYWDAHGFNVLCFYGYSTATTSVGVIGEWLSQCMYQYMSIWVHEVWVCEYMMSFLEWNKLINLCHHSVYIQTILCKVSWFFWMDGCIVLTTFSLSNNIIVEHRNYPWWEGKGVRWSMKNRYQLESVWVSYVWYTKANMFVVHFFTKAIMYPG